ncbi:MAG: N-acetylmuramoyl-L-alanine amidase [Clostridia bacterium]|nr:N-acetylmuramoyl-L-alanine amidase [Clostridia bacterium]
MNEKKPTIPRPVAERCVTLLTALVVLFGGLTAVSAWRRASLAPEASTGAAATASPAPTGPLSGLTILIDPGHGGYDGGARARDSGTWEKELNLSVALKVEEALTRRGATVLMTRREDVDLTSTPRPAGLTMKRQDMQARIDMAVQGGADMVISIHMNEYRSRAESGPQVFYREGSDSGRLLAGCIQAALIAELQPAKERAALPGDYFILQLDVPSVLVECGFISNAAEEKLLLDSDYQARLAEAVAEGVVEYVRVGQ